MISEELVLSVFVAVVLTVVTLGGLFLIIWTARCLLVQLATDAIALHEQWQAAKNDLERQALALEAMQQAMQQKIKRDAGKWTGV